jgi:hypothetical protein
VVQAATEPDGVTPTQLVPFLRPLLSAHDVSYPPMHPRLGPLITFQLKGLPLFQGYLRASWEFESFRQAREIWHPGLLPVVPARAEPGGSVLQIPRAQLTENEITALTPGLVERVCQTLSRTTASWPVTARASLWQKLDQEASRVLLRPLRNELRDKLSADLDELKSGVLNWGKADREAQDWWTAIEKGNQDQPSLVLSLAIQLAVRQVTIGEFHKATRAVGTKHFDALVYFLDYWRCLSEDEKNISF